MPSAWRPHKLEAQPQLFSGTSSSPIAFTPTNLSHGHQTEFVCVTQTYLALRLLRSFHLPPQCPQQLTLSTIVTRLQVQRITTIYSA